MKLIVTCLSIIICLTSQTAFADDSARRNFGVSFKNINGLSVRKGLNETTMIYGGIAVSQNQRNSENGPGSIITSGTSNVATYTGTVGARQYISNAVLSNYINLEVGRIITKYDNTTNSSTTGSSSIDYQTQVNTAGLAYGIEYFISSNISIEGAAGIGVTWSEQLYPDNAYYSDKSVVFPLVNIALTYYW